MRAIAMSLLTFPVFLVAAGSATMAGEPPETSETNGVPWVTRAVRAPRVQHRVFESAAARTRVSYHIYLPPAYDTDEKARFPVLYWLHGRKGGLPGIAPLSKFFHAAMERGQMPQAIVVFPNGRAGSMWCDSWDGKVPMETVVVKELIPHVDENFRTVADRKGRVVEGFSMGGYGAARFGFKYPGLFGAFSLLGAGPLQRVFSEDIGPAYMAGERRRALRTVYGGDQAYFKALSPWVLAEKGKDAMPADTFLRIAVGSLDGTLAFNREFHEHLEALGIPHSYTVAPGVKHDTLGVLKNLGEENWAFYRSAFGRKADADGATTRLLAVGKPTAANPAETQKRALTAVGKVAAAARRFVPGIVVDELAENVLTKMQVRRGTAQLKVTGNIFRERLRALIKTSGPHDTVIIYTHSHGRKAGFEDAQPLGGMVIDLPVLKPRHKGTLLWDEYADLLLQIPAKNVVVLTMSCFSGGLVEYLDSPKIRDRWKDRQRSQGRNFIVLSSQNSSLPSSPIVKDREVVNPFTYAVARALSGEADGFGNDGKRPGKEAGSKDGKVTIGEFVDYILHVTEHTASEFAGRRNNAKPQCTGSFDRDDVLIAGGGKREQEEERR